MGHRNTAFQEFILTFASPWNLAGKTVEFWSQCFYVSGTITHNDADAETAALALAQPALNLANPSSYLHSFNYYPSGSLVSTVTKLYTAGQHPGTGTAYSGPADPQQLEVTAVAHAPLAAKNTRGKTIYLRKYFHAVSALGSDPNTIGALTSPAGLLSVFNTGAGPHAVVPVSPHTGAPGTAWTMETHLFTHQLRKGKKKKVTASTGLFNQLVQTIGEAAALKLLEKALTTGLPA